MFIAVLIATISPMLLLPSPRDMLMESVILFFVLLMSGGIWM